MPNADGKTTLGKNNYTDNGVNFFSDDHVTGFSPLMQLGQSKINGVFNVNEDGEVLESTFTPPLLGQLNTPPLQELEQKTAYNVGIGAVDFFSDEQGMHVGFQTNQPQGLSLYIRDGGESIIFNGGGEYSSYDGPQIPNAFNVPNQPLEPTENLEDRQSVYNNPGGANEDIFASSALPGQVKDGQPNYDSYNASPEPMLDYYTQIGSVYSLEGRTDKEIPEPPTPPNFAQMAHIHNRAITNAQGGGIESMIISDPQGQTQMAVGMGIEATGGGEQDLQALSQPLDVESTLDSALNNINPDFNNSFSGIL